MHAGAWWLGSGQGAGSLKLMYKGTGMNEQAASCIARLCRLAGQLRPALPAPCLALPCHATRRLTDCLRAAAECRKRHLLLEILAC